MHQLKGVAPKTQPLKREPLRVFAQQAHHDLFAIENRQDRNPKRHLIFVRLNFKPPVLGQTVLVQFEIGQHLQPSRDTRLNGFWERHRVMQDAVNAVAHEHFLFEGFNMNV